MLLYWRKGDLVFETDILPWMRDHAFTEVFDYSNTPILQDEIEITGLLDTILQRVVYGRAGIERTLEKIRSRPAKVIQGKKAGSGEVSLGKAMGDAVDSVFKDMLNHLLEQESYRRYKQMLVATPSGHMGADVECRQLSVAWDVTTAAEVWKHIDRDVIGKRKRVSRPRIYKKPFDRYYLLVWDEPRTDHTSQVAAIQAGRTSRIS